jgi:hypothetical protein
MKVHASKAEFERLPDWVLEFVNAAWAPRDGFGQRAPRDHFNNIREVAGRFADHLREAMRDPGVCEHNISLLLTDAPRLVEATVIIDPQIKVAHALMQAWNVRATLADCVVCGCLMQPSRGKTAQTCSGACRVKHHRRMEELREEKRRDDEMSELRQEHEEEMESYNYGEDED